MSSTPQLSRSHVIIIPSYNPGPRFIDTIKAALAQWQPVWVVIDGSTDNSPRQVRELPEFGNGLRIVEYEQNRGKGAAVLEGMKAALKEGFSWALVMDADGQHPAERVPQLMRLSAANPDAIVLGVPQFGTDAPKERVFGHKLADFWTNVETLWGGIGDSLFGFRVYPMQAAVELLQSITGGHKFDFETQMAVRLFWRGFQPINVAVPVRYFSDDDGGVSHFRYLRDNLLLIGVHALLLTQTPWRMLRRKKGAIQPRNN